jgi:hypothetical protein
MQIYAITNALYINYNYMHVMNKKYTRIKYHYLNEMQK